MSIQCQSNETPYLVGGLEHESDFPFSWDNSIYSIIPLDMTHIFQRGMIKMSKLFTQFIYIYTLVGGFKHDFYFSIQLGMSSSQLTNNYEYFSEGVGLNHQPVYIYTECWHKSQCQSHEDAEHRVVFHSGIRFK